MRESAANGFPLQCLSYGPAQRSTPRSEVSDHCSEILESTDWIYHLGLWLSDC
jgi:hypothetical protein